MSSAGCERLSVAPKLMNSTFLCLELPVVRSSFQAMPGALQDFIFIAMPFRVLTCCPPPAEYPWVVHAQNPAENVCVCVCVFVGFAVVQVAWLRTLHTSFRRDMRGSPATGLNNKNTL